MSEPVGKDAGTAAAGAAPGAEGGPSPGTVGGVQPGAAGGTMAGPATGVTAAATVGAVPDPSALRWLLLSLGVLVLDQATKAAIVARFELYERIDALPVLEITRLHNYGAAFSFLHDAGGWQHYFFVTLATLVSAGIVWWLSRLRLRADRMLAVGLASILGGAVGNLVDRLVHGHVVDFIHFHWGRQWYFPAFNFADTAITIGAGLLILDSFLESRRTRSA